MTIIDNKGRLLLSNKVIPYGNLVLSDFTSGRLLFVGSDLSISEDANLTFDGTTLSAPTLASTNPVAFNARIAVRKNTGAVVGTRRRLNLIEGANITLTVADDSGDEEVDVTIAGTGGGSGPLNKQTEVDFGATPVAEASFVVVDVDVTATSKIIGGVAYQAPTGKDLDELEMDGLDVKFAPGTGQLTIYARGLDGYVADKFLINYQVAA